MSHCVAGVPPVVACGVVPLDVANSTAGFPRLFAVIELTNAAGMNSSEVRDFYVAPCLQISRFSRLCFIIGTPC